MQDKDAFCQLIRLYTPNMYKVAKAILKNDEDAADAIQETVLTCWEKINTLQKDNYFKTWLIRILINHCNTIYRQKSRIISDAEMTEPSYTETNYSSVEWQEFLTCLDEKYRILILLYYVEGFKIREIAEILQLNEKTVSGRLASARDKMEKNLYPKNLPSTEQHSPEQLKGDAIMNKFNHTIKHLQNNNEVPPIVMEKLEHTLDTLPSCAGRHRHSHIWKTCAAAAACMILAGSAICFANPALAAKLPLIGKIFAEIEETVTFPGNYSSKASELSTAEKEKPKTLSDNSDEVPLYTISADGITITASEIYCDGLSVFLTAQISHEQGGFSRIPEHYTGKNSTAANIYLCGTWQTENMSEPQEFTNTFLEGSAADDNTFIGMLKLNLPDFSQKNSILNLNITGFGWDEVTMIDAEDISESHHIESQWNLNIPFNIDADTTKEIQIDQSAKGYTLEKIFVSPYQVITYVDVPYTEREVTREEYEEKTGVESGASDPDLSYEAYAEMAGKEYRECSVVVCTSDGEVLTPVNPTDSIYGKTVFTTSGKDVSSLEIYVFESFEDAIKYEKSSFQGNGFDMEAARKDAVIHSIIPLK